MGVKSTKLPKTLKPVKKPSPRASMLKGVYNLNPTQAVMKTGGLLQRIGTTEDVPGFKKVKPAGPRKPTAVKQNKGKRK